MSQENVDITTGATRLNEIYYNFDKGIVKYSDIYAWDIAFSTKNNDGCILINEGREGKLYTYNKGDISQWNNVDTSGMLWEPLHNSMINCEKGAFNAHSNNTGDFGWGVLNTSENVIYGDSIYILDLTRNVFLKLAIIKKDLSENTYEFKYANIDGEDEYSHIINLNDYSGSLVHFSLFFNESVYIYPDDRWHLVFTQYFDCSLGEYEFGALANTDVLMQQVNSVSQQSFTDYNINIFTDTLTLIGCDWKSYNDSSRTYDISSDVVYFVRDMQENNQLKTIWKLYFTEYKKLPAGKLKFVQEKLYHEPIGLNYEMQGGISIYPNPFENYFIINLERLQASSIIIYNMQGELVKQEKLNRVTSYQVDMSDFSGGVYFIKLNQGRMSYIKKIMKI